MKKTPAPGLPLEKTNLLPHSRRERAMPPGAPALFNSDAAERQAEADNVNYQRGKGPSSCLTYRLAPVISHQAGSRVILHSSENHPASLPLPVGDTGLSA